MAQRLPIFYIATIFFVFMNVSTAFAAPEIPDTGEILTSPKTTAELQPMDLKAISFDEKTYTKLIAATLVQGTPGDSTYPDFLKIKTPYASLYIDEKEAYSTDLDDDDYLYMKGEEKGIIPGTAARAVMASYYDTGMVDLLLMVKDNPSLLDDVLFSELDTKIYADPYGNFVRKNGDLNAPNYLLGPGIMAQYLCEEEINLIEWDRIKGNLKFFNLNGELQNGADIPDAAAYYKTYTAKLETDADFRELITKKLVEETRSYAEERNAVFQQTAKAYPEEFNFNLQTPETEGDVDIQESIRQILTGGAGKVLKLTLNNLFFDAYEEWVMNFSGRVIFYTFTTEEIGMNQLKSIFMVIIVLGIMLFITWSIYWIMIGKITLSEMLKRTAILVVVMILPITLYDQAIQKVFNDTNVYFMAKNIERLLVMDRWALISELSADEEAKKGGRVAANYEFRSQNYNHIVIFNTNRYTDLEEAQDKLAYIKTLPEEEYNEQKLSLSDKRVKLFVDANHLMNFLNLAAKSGEIPGKNALFEYLSKLERSEQELTLDPKFYPNLEEMLDQNIYSMQDSDEAEKFGEQSYYIGQDSILNDSRFGGKKEASASQVMAAVVIFYGAGSYDGTTPAEWKEIVNTNAAVESWLTQVAASLGDVNQKRFILAMNSKSVTFTVSDAGTIAYQAGTGQMLMDDEKVLIESFKKDAEAVLKAAPDAKESIIKVCAHPDTFLACNADGIFELHKGGEVDVMDTASPDANDAKDEIAKMVEDEPFNEAIKLKTFVDFLVDPDLQLTSAEVSTWINRASHTKSFNNLAYGTITPSTDEGQTLKDAKIMREGMIYNNILEGGDICNVEPMLKSFCTFKSDDQMELMVVNINERVIQKYMDNMHITREAAASSESNFEGLYNNSEGDTLKMYISMEVLNELQMEPAGISVDRTEVDAYFRTLIIPLKEMKPDNPFMGNAAEFTGMYLSTATMAVFVVLVFLLLAYGVAKTLVITVALLPFYLVMALYRYIWKVEEGKLWFGAVYTFGVFALCHAGLMFLWYVLPTYTNIASVDYESIGALASVSGPLLSILIIIMYLVFVLVKVYKPTVQTILQNPGDMGGEVFADKLQTLKDNVMDKLSPGPDVKDDDVRPDLGNSELAEQETIEGDDEIMLDSTQAELAEERAQNINDELARRDVASREPYTEGPADVIADGGGVVADGGDIQADNVIADGGVIADDAITDGGVDADGVIADGEITADGEIQADGGVMADGEVLADDAIADGGVLADAKDLKLGSALVSGMDKFNEVAGDQPGTEIRDKTTGNPFDPDSLAMYGPIAGAIENVAKKGYEKALDASEGNETLHSIVETGGAVVDDLVDDYRPRQMAKKYLDGDELLDLSFGEGDVLPGSDDLPGQDGGDTAAKVAQAAKAATKAAKIAQKFTV